MQLGIAWTAATGETGRVVYLPLSPGSELRLNSAKVGVGGRIVRAVASLRWGSEERSDAWHMAPVVSGDPSRDRVTPWKGCVQPHW